MELCMGPADRADAYLTAGVELARRAEDEWLLATGYGALGFVRHDQGRDKEALACFHAAHSRGRGIGRPHLISGALMSVADLHLAVGHCEARVLLSRAATLIERTGDVRLHTLTLVRLGRAEHDEGDLGAAAAVYRRALARHRTLSPLDEPNDGRMEMDIRCRLGRTHRAAGQVVEAREQFRSALAVPGADRYPQEHAQAVEGVDGC